MNDEHKTYFTKKKRWTDVEKRLLLNSLKKHGTKDIQRIKSYLPNKSKISIEQMIQKYRAIAELGKKEVNSPIDIWLRSGIFSEENDLVPEALLFIYLFEKHPPPEETAGIDIRQIYKFLYETTQGTASMSTLSPYTAKMFKELLVTVDKETWPANELSTTDYLIGRLCKIESENCYQKNTTE